MSETDRSLGLDHLAHYIHDSIGPIYLLPALNVRCRQYQNSRLFLITYTTENKTIGPQTDTAALPDRTVNEGHGEQLYLVWRLAPPTRSSSGCGPFSGYRAPTSG